jgi:hypothetical protein
MFEGGYFKQLEVSRHRVLCDQLAGLLVCVIPVQQMKEIQNYFEARFREGAGFYRSVKRCVKHQAATSRFPIPPPDLLSGRLKPTVR